MEEKEKAIQQLTQEVAKWKNRALEASQTACDNCEEYDEGRKRCNGCRILKIREEAVDGAD